MSYPTVFANLTAGNQPASLLDTMYAICGNQGNIPCTAVGTNAITLTPNTNFFLPASYQNYQMATFAAVANSTGSCTIKIAGLAFIKLFNPDGTQAGAGNIVSGNLYAIFYNSALDTGAGGFIIAAQTAVTNVVQRSATVSPITIQATDQIINININAGSPSVSLPAASTRNGKALTFKDVGGHATAHNITITPFGADTIDGAASFVMNVNFQAVTINPFADGVNSGWFVT